MRNKGLFIVWVILLFIIFGLLSAFGFIYKGKLSKYNNYEKILVESARKYTYKNAIYPTDGKSISINIDELIDKKYVNKKDIVKECSGKVIVTKNGFIDYKANIKCKYYKSKI